MQQFADNVISPNQIIVYLCEMSVHGYIYVIVASHTIISPNPNPNPTTWLVQQSDPPDEDPNWPKCIMISERPRAKKLI